MAFTLTPEQEAWLRAHVANGDFPSVEEAARQLIDERIAERELEDSDDLIWARQHVDEGIAALERGDVISLEEHKSRNKARLADLVREAGHFTAAKINSRFENLYDQLAEHPDSCPTAAFSAASFCEAIMNHDLELT
jgi:antitoxin ParD1/3/4